MPYLVDSNVWLELLLEQERAAEVRRFLDLVNGDELALSDFALHSIGLAFIDRFRRPDVFLRFVRETIETAGVSIVRLTSADFDEIVEANQNFGLDFDDAYQYVAAKRTRRDLVTFDAHFDRTTRGRKTPASVIAELEPQPPPPTQPDAAE